MGMLVIRLFKSVRKKKLNISPIITDTCVLVKGADQMFQIVNEAHTSSIVQIGHKVPNKPEILQSKCICRYFMNLCSCVVVVHVGKGKRKLLLIELRRLRKTVIKTACRNMSYSHIVVTY